MSDTTAPVTPRDAASLLIVRERNGQSQVLMGKRPAKDRFMPDVFVFPGGRVDPDDAR
ncbi:MAG: NUDIX hydrolase, partial [Deltaproteobacteria bacterium]|nr:NUDIX hydrolase [Deltaproteobacteria bacterium]